MNMKETMCAAKFDAHNSSCLAFTECLVLFRLCLSSARTRLWKRHARRSTCGSWTPWKEALHLYGEWL